MLMTTSPARFDWRGFGGKRLKMKKTITFLSEKGLISTCSFSAGDTIVVPKGAVFAYVTQKSIKKSKSKP